MKKTFLCLLAMISFCGAAPAKAAATVTATEIQVWGQAVVDYITANPSAVSNLTATDVQNLKTAFTALATSSQISSYVNVYNNVLATSSGCTGIGTYPNVNQTNLNTCSNDIQVGLSTAGLYNEGALMGGVAALSKAMGAPLTIPGTTATVPMPAPTTPTTTLATTTTTRAATTTTGATTTTTSSGSTTTTTKSTTTTTIRNAEKEAAAAATTAISSQVQRATTIQQAVTIINVLSSIANPRATVGPQRVALGDKKGMAAGEPTAKWNAWMNASRGYIANTFANIFADTRFDGNVDNWIGGMDYGINKDLVVGVSVGYDRTKLDTHYNKGNFKSEGYMFAPYVSYQINKMFSIDAVAGYADGDTDLRSNAFGLITAKQDFERNFAAINLSAVQWIDDAWQLTGKVSYISAEEKLKHYTDSSNAFVAGQTNRLEQFRLGAQVGYWANGIMPYIGLTYINDVNAPSTGLINVSNSKEAYSVATGVNVFGKDVMGSLSYTSERGRSHSRNNVLMGSVSYRF
ncbi:MAG: autotransporter outer membrane beta-barrel domain-containing protein [Sterolibacterium sp.]